jgi:secondary thiamine-phosphate synthase enzyme
MKAGLALVTDSVTVPTRGNDHIVDITGHVQEVVQRQGFQEGQALVFVSGSTAGLTTLEYEPGLIEDLPAAFETIAPRDAHYRHEEAWHDGNGHSHVRASLLGPSLCVPFKGGRLLLGTWQQVVLVDFDNRPRQRQLVVQLTGERRQA